MRARRLPLALVLAVSLVATTTTKTRAEDAAAPAPAKEEVIDVRGRPRAGPLDATPMHLDPMMKWQRNQPQPFVGANVEGGYPYVRATLQVGWGRPHYMWSGVEGQAQGTEHFGAIYVGGRAALPWLSVRAGARYVKPLLHTMQDAKRSHDVRDIETDRGGDASYTLYELEALPEIRAGRGFVVGTFTAAAVRGIQSDEHVYEENLRVVVALPVVLRARLGYLFDIKPLARARLGFAGEVIHVPGREGDDVVVRAGLLGMWRLHEQVDVLVQLLPVVRSPDRLGLLGVDMNHLGVRYRWATPDVPGPRER